MNTKIKICGLKTIKEIETAYRSGSFWYGLIFYKKSHRDISIEKARYLVLNSPPKIKPVAVVVDEKIEKIDKISRIGIKTIQLHGRENVEFCKYLKDKYNFKIIKAINISDQDDIMLAKKYIRCADWILYDYKGKSSPGGSGRSFDWNILKNKELKFKWILSGGLNCSNVKSAIKTTNAQVVDVSSGVETILGEKSEDLIEKFCNSVKLF